MRIIRAGISGLHAAHRPAAAALSFGSGPRVPARTPTPAALVSEAPTPVPCRDDPAYRQLDFWIGTWEVFNPKGERDGENVIEKVLDGCAIVENWTDAQRGNGKSLFYYRRAEHRWKQVWVTDLGGVKEKSQQLDFPGPGLRFQGELQSPSGGTILDRTTLTGMPDGRVRQVIEQSRDGGKTWTAWEGIYVRVRKTES